MTTIMYAAPSSMFGCGPATNDAISAATERDFAKLILLNMASNPILSQLAEIEGEEAECRAIMSALSQGITLEIDLVQQPHSVSARGGNENGPSTLCASDLGPGLRRDTDSTAATSVNPDASQADDADTLHSEPEARSQQEQEDTEWLTGEGFAKFKADNAKYVRGRVLGTHKIKGRNLSVTPLMNCLRNMSAGQSTFPDERTHVAMLAAVDCAEGELTDDMESKLTDPDLSKRTRGIELWSDFWGAQQQDPTKQNMGEVYGDVLGSDIGQATVEWATGLIREAFNEKRKMTDASSNASSVA